MDKMKSYKEIVKDSTESYEEMTKIDVMRKQVADIHATDECR
jgi:hypothetical protein